MHIKEKIYLHFSRMAFAVLSTILIICSPATSLISHAEPRVQDYGDELVIVIDPGHGGENLGTIENGFEEKTMTLLTAQAMYDELVQYDNVTVYMTRTDDRDLDLAERAQFAADVNADFLFSIHYNASANHSHFGSEIWISSKTPYNSYGYQFGYNFLSEMEDMGLFLRGIKTRTNNKGEDYYGVIRESVNRSVPAVILEHCHVDEARDIPYCATEAEWIAFGKRDALAVAKYFGLSSSALGLDYTQDSLNLPFVKKDSFVQSTYRDETKPDICIIELLDAKYDTGQLMIDVTATDYDSPLLYYDYSIDGGENFSESIPWPGVDLLDEKYSDTFTLSLQIPSGTKPEIILRAYNLADLYLESNTLFFADEFIYSEKTAEDEQKAPETNETNKTTETQEPVSYEIPEKERHSAGTITFTPEEKELPNEENGISFFTFLIICLIIVILIFITLLISQAINYNRRKKRRRQRIKELENSINQSK